MSNSLRRLVALAVLATLPFLYLSARAGEAVPDTAVQAGADTPGKTTGKAPDAVAEGEAEEGMEGDVDDEESMAETLASLEKATDEYATQLMANPPEGMTKGDVAMVFGNLYALGAIGAPEPDKAKGYLETALANGVPEAGVALGALSMSPHGPDESGDIPKAIGYYETAAKAGATDAMRILGRLYLDGDNGVEKNVEKGERYLLDAARRGDEYALDRLDDKFKEAAEWEKANPGKKAAFPTSREAAVDTALAEKQLQWNKRMGDNIEKVYGGLERILYQSIGMDYEAMVKRRELEEQFAASFAKLADEVVASRPDKKSAGETAFAIGAVYAFGMAGAVDLDQAEKYYTIAAENGVPEGLAALGEIHSGGIPSPEFAVKQDTAKAIQYYNQAADAGVSRAMFALGELYENGRDDLEPDLAKAVGYYRRSAEWGDEGAVQKLGELAASLPEDEKKSLDLPADPKSLVDPAKEAKTKARLEEIYGIFEQTQTVLRDRMNAEITKLQERQEAAGADATAKDGAATPAPAPAPAAAAPLPDLTPSK